jgi:DNA-binding NarL/FixJ family response regulator
VKGHRVLIADDHAIIRAGLCSLLSTASEAEIVGEAKDGQEAIRMALLLKPDVVLMDLSMPHINGTEAIAEIKRCEPEIRIIALTVHNTEEYVWAALEAGADGYVLKDDTHSALLAAIDGVMLGRSYLSPAIAQHVIQGLLGQSAPHESSRSWDILTVRERELLKLIAEGKRNKDIAEYLALSPRTVEKHRASLMRKLDLHSAAELTAFAIENKLVGA